MSGWIVAAALGSVAITALLTFVLWRVNAPLRERAADDGGAGYVAPIALGGDTRSAREDSPDGGSDAGGGGDGGGGK